MGSRSIPPTVTDTIALEGAPTLGTAPAERPIRRSGSGFRWAGLGPDERCSKAAGRAVSPRPMTTAMTTVSVTVGVAARSATLPRSCRPRAKVTGRRNSRLSVREHSLDGLLRLANDCHVRPGQDVGQIGPTLRERLVQHLAVHLPDVDREVVGFVGVEALLDERRES